MSPTRSRVVALSGGVGGAKLADGLARVLDPGALAVIVNTGDDFRHLGLWISPDIDSVVYALAGLADPVRGWGRRDESWNFMAALKRLGAPDWFQLGDADLAMHVERTQRLAAGETLTRVTACICRALGVSARVLPMSDDIVSTRVETADGWLDFQDYFVRRQCRPRVQQIAFEGAASARVTPEIVAALEDPALRAVVVCPSNPFLSIEPMLAIAPLRALLARCAAPIIAVTPIIGGAAVKGPAAKMLRELGLAVDAAAVAGRYQGLLDGFIADASDPAPEPIDGVTVIRAPTLMRTAEDRAGLARCVLELADRLS
jgi:LPPG:FO 2-phospho-L-lactate transferase